MYLSYLCVSTLSYTFCTQPPTMMHFLHSTIHTQFSTSSVLQIGEKNIFENRTLDQWFYDTEYTLHLGLLKVEILGTLGKSLGDLRTVNILAICSNARGNQMHKEYKN